MATTYRPLDGGYQTLITFPSGPSASGPGSGIVFRVLSIQPPGLDAGAPIETHSMASLQIKTKAPRALIGITDGELTVSYDPYIYTSCLAAISKNQLIVVTFPDVSTLTFWGYCGSLVPDALEEGKRPTAKMKLIATCQDASGVEVPPALTEGPGTGAGG